MSKRILTKKLYHGSFVPEWLTSRSHKEISDGAKLLYGRLHRFIGDNGVCWPTIPTLAQELGKSTRQIDRLLKELKDLKLIESIQVGKKCANRYYMLEHAWMGSCFSDTTDMATHSESDTTDMAYPMVTTDVSCPHKESQGRESLTRIFNHWKKVHNHPASVLDDKRARKIKQALKNYSEESAFHAIEGCKHSPHNMGKNDRNTVFDDIEIILRDAKNIERFIGLYEKNINADDDDWIY